MTNNSAKFEILLTNALTSGEIHSYLIESIIPAGSLTPAEAINVYQRAYVARLTEALGETYEGVWRVLGDSDFFKTAENYIRENNSASYNLSDYGNSFPEFLSKMWGDEFPFLADLARFEQVFKVTFHSGESQPVDDPILFRGLLEDGTSLRFSPSFSLFTARTSIYEFWKRRKEALLLHEEFNFYGQEFLAVYKRNSRVFVKKLEDAQYKFLNLLMNGLPFIDAVSMLSASLEENQVQDLTLFILESGAVAAISEINSG